MNRDTTTLSRLRADFVCAGTTLAVILLGAALVHWMMAVL